EVIVAPPGQLVDGMRGEEIAVGLGGRELPGGVLDAVLADVKVKPARVVRPCAPRTVEATVLVVHHEERAEALQRLPGPLEHLGDASRRAPPRRRMMVLVARALAVGGGTAPERLSALHRPEHQLLRVLPPVGCGCQRSSFRAANQQAPMRRESATIIFPRCRPLKRPIAEPDAEACARQWSGALHLRR